ncbi:MAG: NUDIX domain-containing protein [Egibacteraceae bacterium]
MGRVDYYQDENAPQANSLVPGASAIVTDDQGRVLLHKRADNENWALPSGTMDFGERLHETAVRETREETGVEVEVEGLVGIYSDPEHVFAYDDGEVRQEFNICFARRVVGGELGDTDDEALDVGWFTREEVEALTMHPSIRLRIHHHFEERDRPYLG